MDRNNGNAFERKSRNLFLMFILHHLIDRLLIGRFKELMNL